MKKYPKIGIRPTIDGRQGGVRESLEEKTMNLAKAVAELISTNLRNGDGTPVQSTRATIRRRSSPSTARPRPKSSLRPAPDTDSTASSSPIWAVTTAAPQLRSSWRRTRGAATIPTSYSSSADTPPSSRASRTRRFLRSVTTSSS